MLVVEFSRCQVAVKRTQKPRPPSLAHRRRVASVYLSSKALKVGNHPSWIIRVGDSFLLQSIPSEVNGARMVGILYRNIAKKFGRNLRKVQEKFKDSMRKIANEH